MIRATDGSAIQRFPRVLDNVAEIVPMVGLSSALAITWRGNVLSATYGQGVCRASTIFEEKHAVDLSQGPTFLKR